MMDWVIILVMQALHLNFKKIFDYYYPQDLDYFQQVSEFILIPHSALFLI